MRLIQSGLLALLLCLGSSAVAAEWAHVTYDLFNGKDLNGWIVTNCKADVHDGALRLAEGNGFVRTSHQYRDFILELDYKSPKSETYDSGIYFRAPFPSKNPKRNWPDVYQINLKRGDETNLKISKINASSIGLTKDNEWNHVRLKVVGKTAELEVNGKPAWKTDAITVEQGFVGFQAEVPLGGQFEFKNIKITELGFFSLFNGKDLGGWVGATNSFKVNDGVLEFIKGKQGNIFTKDEYENFVLRFDFLLDPATNNGVGLRTPLEGDIAYEGIEIQILDTEHSKYKDILPYQAHGSVYGTAPAKRGFLKPSGEWNTQEIIMNGRHITVTLNGTVINDVDLDKAAPNGKTIDGKEHPGLARKTGHIGFLGHQDHIQLRNIRVMKLPSGKE